jgi:hypothetical protein
MEFAWYKSSCAGRVCGSHQRQLSPANQRAGSRARASSRAGVRRKRGAKTVARCGASVLPREVCAVSRQTELPAPKHGTDGPRSRIARTQGNRLRFGLLLCVSENITAPGPLGRLGAGLLRRGKIRLREKCKSQFAHDRSYAVNRRWNGTPRIAARSNVTRA